ncbi:BBSome-interacting protein 1 isoform X1 [Chiroxiphia lanceolata]|uniref:BBSome-interacting protein 1 isoform X1 n=1 Tax=Chiroxiphia lanceolata TaxID=296741 RepID=UPI0013CEBDD6|nr:BBSome-interacting protein 1 isoform X1 [Chiroxiphia lanceolata]
MPEGTGALREVLPKQGQLSVEDAATMALCKPKILPLKSVSLEKLEKLQRAALEAAPAIEVALCNGACGLKSGLERRRWCCPGRGRPSVGRFSCISSADRFKGEVLNAALEVPEPPPAGAALGRPRPTAGGAKLHNPTALSGVYQTRLSRASLVCWSTSCSRAWNGYSQHV